MVSKEEAGKKTDSLINFQAKKRNIWSGSTRSANMLKKKSHYSTLTFASGRSSRDLKLTKKNAKKVKNIHKSIVDSE